MILSSQNEDEHFVEPLLYLEVGQLANSLFIL